MVSVQTIGVVTSIDQSSVTREFFELFKTRRALEARNHVLVEKPLATTVAEVDTLSRCAADRGLVVMAGHTFIYNPAGR